MQLPERHYTHILEESSRIYFRNAVPIEWIINKPEHDYGIDAFVDIVEASHVTGLNFSVQLKAKETDNSKEFVTAKLANTTLNYLNVRLEPCMLIVYVRSEDEAYWEWVENLGIDLSKKTVQTHTVRVSRKNKLSALAWQEIARAVGSIFNKKSLLRVSSVIDFTNISDLEKEAWQTYFHGLYEDASFLFRKLLRTEPDNLQWLQTQANCDYYSFKYPEALAVVNRAIDIEPKKELLLVKACILAEFGIQIQEKAKLMEAKEVFGRFIADYPDNALYHYNYANTLSALKDSAEAEKHYLISLAINPNQAQVWKNLGQVYFDLHQHKKEMDCYDKALRVNPALPEALMSKGVTLAMVFKKFSDSYALMEKALELAPDMPEQFFRSHFWMAYVLSELDQFDASLQWLKKGLDIRPQDEWLLGLKSRLLAQIWKKNNTYRDVARTFFKYRFDLDRDYHSLYDYLCIRIDEGADHMEIFGTIKKQTPFFQNTSFEEFQKTGITSQDTLICLPYMDRYAQLRNTYPIGRYADDLLLGEFSVGMTAWEMLDFCFACCYGDAYMNFKKNNNTKALVKTFMERFGDLVPRIVCFFIPRTELSEAAKGHVLAALLSGFQVLTLREMGCQAGYLAGTCNFTLSEKQHQQMDSTKFSGHLLEKNLMNLNRQLKLLRED